MTPALFTSSVSFECDFTTALANLATLFSELRSKVSSSADCAQFLTGSELWHPALGRTPAAQKDRGATSRQLSCCDEAYTAVGASDHCNLSRKICRHRVQRKD
eukprot:CAMPEP_0115141566 /NCGR_PEP_ID=MMETSP0227-20121206/59617_1 /TAXON_ID=89957 /ORGANISM="Polarella glacialis, Strain CCMP 1383" /LENGTH=102 /DNA_ID=CAMNT_0002549959 /DNA_START=509 /DNA_END=818 /DNA_ORIENTATION=-